MIHRTTLTIWYLVRIGENTDQKAPYLDTFHAVIFVQAAHQSLSGL